MTYTIQYNNQIKIAVIKQQNFVSEWKRKKKETKNETKEGILWL